MGGHLPWGVSRLSHRLGVLVLKVLCMLGKPPWLLGEMLGQIERVEKLRFRSRGVCSAGLPPGRVNSGLP